MGVPLFKNNAGTILASNITNSQTTVPLNTGTGALFPNPSGGDYFMLTVISASNPSIFEVMQCTSRSGDTLTVVRAQEGTAGQAFNASDIVRQLWTSRDVLDNRTQRNMPTAGGTANAPTVANSSPISAFIKGLVQRWIPSAANTAAATLAIDGFAATALRAFGQPLIGGEMQTGVPIEGDYDGTVIHLTNPLITALGLASGALEATIFNANGTFTPKISGTYIVVGIAGGGGGGGGGNGTAGNGGGGGCGGSGGEIGINIFTLTAGVGAAVVVGTGGTGGAHNADGNQGNNTTFNGTTVASGGQGGRGGNTSVSAAAVGFPGTNGGGYGGGIGSLSQVSVANGGNGVVNTGGGGGGAGGGNGANNGGTGGNGGRGVLWVIRA